MTEPDEPDRSSTPPSEGEDHPPPSTQREHAWSTIEIEFFDASGDLTEHELHTLRDLSTRVLAQLPNAGSIRVRIVHDDDMIAAHQKYCDLATTTDVLTFDLAQHETDFATKHLDTDLIICVDEATRQARQRSHTRVHELLLYTLHGTLHCLGYDDLTETQYARMHAREDQLLTSAGIGALFQDTPHDHQEFSS